MKSLNTVRGMINYLDCGTPALSKNKEIYSIFRNSGGILDSDMFFVFASVIFVVELNPESFKFQDKALKFP